MNDKERLRLSILEMLKQKRIRIKQAAEQCGICYDQMLRIYKKFISEGDAGLIFGPRGRISIGNAIEKEIPIANDVNIKRNLVS